jgi:hypothetical protein
MNRRKWKEIKDKKRTYRRKENNCGIIIKDKSNLKCAQLVEKKR